MRNSELKHYTRLEWLMFVTHVTRIFGFEPFLVLILARAKDIIFEVKVFQMLGNCFNGTMQSDSRPE